MNRNRTILIMAGGTGGHVFPALSVAAELQQQGFRVEWLGTPRGIENELVVKTGIHLNRIDISGVRGKGMLGLLQAPVKIFKAIRQTHRLLKTLQPAAVIGFGGYVTGPGGVAAKLAGVPLLIHEQNAIAGLTNKLLRPLSNCTLQAFPNTLKNAITVGNPVRVEVAAIENPLSRYRLAANVPLKVLVVGGSLGAQALNNLVLNTMELLATDARPELRHQVGKTNFESMQAAYARANIDAHIVPFIDDIASSYAWADLVICRAGALTVAEVAAAGVAALFVPFPFAVDDHQTANANYLVNKNAALMVQQAELSATKLAAKLKHFNAHREELLNLASNARVQAITTATATVVQQIMRFCRG